MNLNIRLLLLSVVLLISFYAVSQDPVFHIYLCFGQSDMEGASKAGLQDSTVNPRFQAMAAFDCENLLRTKGNWYPAIPPLCRCRLSWIRKKVRHKNAATYGY